MSARVGGGLWPSDVVSYNIYSDEGYPDKTPRERVMLAGSEDARQGISG
jgi:hypothetical protein